MLKAFQSCYEKVGYVYIAMVSAMIVFMCAVFTEELHLLETACRHVLNRSMP